MTFCGTSEYMAPEAILERGSGRPVDWWSLGVLLYELLYNVPPFFEQDVQKMYVKAIVEKVRFPKRPKISKNCKDLIRNLLKKNPILRMGTLGDTLEIMNHKFFKDFNWFKLLAKKLKPPYDPFQENRNWLNNFGIYFNSKSHLDSFCAVETSFLKKYDEDFTHFNGLEGQVNR